MVYVILWNLYYYVTLFHNTLWSFHLTFPWFSYSITVWSWSLWNTVIIMFLCHREIDVETISFMVDYFIHYLSSVTCEKAQQTLPARLQMNIMRLNEMIRNAELDLKFWLVRTQYSFNQGPSNIRNQYFSLALWFANIFSLPMGCLFTLLILTFVSKMFSVFDEVQHIKFNLFLIVLCFWTISAKSNVIKISPYIFLYFIVLALKFRFSSVDW